MTSETRRDPRTDPLLTPENAALVVIDFQPTQVSDIRSMDPALMARNAVSLAQLAKAFGMPIVLSTVNVGNGLPPTIAELKAVLADDVALDRTQINAWEDVEFHAAIEARRPTAPGCDASNKPGLSP